MKYNISERIGKSRYVVNFHDRIKTHSDGSEFWDIAIFRNKLAMGHFVAGLEKAGYKK